MGAVEAFLLSLYACAIIVEQLPFQLLGYIDASVLQQGDKIEGEVLMQGILKIKDADPGRAFALRQPDEIGRVEVAQEPARGLRQEAIEHGPPHGLKLGAHCLRSGCAFQLGPEPIEQQVGLDLEGCKIATGQLVARSIRKWERGRDRNRTQAQERIDGSSPHDPLRSSRSHFKTKQAVAQVFHQQQAVREVRRQNFRRA